LIRINAPAAPAITMRATSQEPAMYQRILVPVDGSATSNKALTAALQLAREGGGRVRVVHAFDELVFLTGYEYDASMLRAARAEADKVLSAASGIATAAGVPSDAKLLETRGRRLGDAVADEATAWEADLVVVGTHGRRGIGRAVLGSGAEQVIRAAPVPVLSIRASEATAAK
jgi:nucleotide-binding universal stress UspA family protein